MNLRRKPSATLQLKRKLTKWQVTVVPEQAEELIFFDFKKDVLQRFDVFGGLYAKGVVRVCFSEFHDSDSARLRVVFVVAVNPLPFDFHGIELIYLLVVIRLRFLQRKLSVAPSLSFAVPIVSRQEVERAMRYSAILGNDYGRGPDKFVHSL